MRIVAYIILFRAAGRICDNVRTLAINRAFLFLTTFSSRATTGIIAEKCPNEGEESRALN